MAANLISLKDTEPNMEPEYEVRLRLNPAEVLGPDHRLAENVLLTFDMLAADTKLNVQFLDRNCKEIYAAGWSPRIRKTENEDDFELTYKKRYAITGGDIDAALTAANGDGFNAGDAKYEAQVEWGYRNQTLSISRKKTGSKSENDGMGLPGTSESRQMLIDEAPDKFDNWKHREWGTSALSVSRVFGPVLARRFTGKWKNMKLYVEVWPLLNLGETGIEYFVEASFKTKSHTTASLELGHLADFLQKKGWFLPEDVLKTRLIMERY
ncbi:hypothetical protein P168DRAFT_307052 [Aspergillus campestris IBT 28561]|uniref:CYTH domain-containing protein n=1 Tax=Aspergillus campestris (strain IBT 28561) TaxID=1392248 RepID=A0A2I1CUA0_ASPC2|nr:uncharacterized protein P168DRAFT_307052 [Aspergillus campestris IBT 28561]PKY01195.1 hypothetical protein P168DRAFT_307052 [Aspergillus campestris IBT 28561]